MFRRIITSTAASICRTVSAQPMHSTIRMSAAARAFSMRHYDDRLVEQQAFSTVEYLRYQDNINEMYGRFDQVDSAITRLENKIDTRFGALEIKISEVSKERKDIHSAMHRVEYELRAQRDHADLRKGDLQKTRIAAFGVVVAISFVLSQFKKQ